MKLKDFQDRFQRAILAGDDAILDSIPDGAHEKKHVLLGVYRDAYVLRLVEIIGNDHERLRAFMGLEAFDALARAYIADCPSQHPNARHVSRRLPDFMREHESYRERPVLADLAALERALNDAFDGPDAPVISVAALAQIPPEAWGRLRLAIHPAVLELAITTNADEIWAALKREADPPAAAATEKRTLLVWRQDETAKFRALAAEEAMMLERARAGVHFGELCVLLATFADPETAPARAAGYLGGWLDSGLLSAATAD